MPNHIVLAYSGGLDTSVAIHWLKQQHDAQVTAVLIDVGQPIPGIEDAKKRALHNGAAACIVIDAKDEFAQEYVAAAILADALYEGAYPLATALGRPLIAKKLVAVALEHGADAIAHGCTGKGNDQVRIEAGVHALAPHLEVLAPQRTHPMTREAVLRYADQHGLQLPPQKKSPYSVDENLWGRSAEGHDVEDPAHAVPEAAFSWTTDPTQAPAAGQKITIAFEHGLPVSVDGVPMTLTALIQHLNTVAGQHGVGRIDHVEDRLVGIKTREVYEAPAATVILAAKKAVESLTLTRDEVLLKPSVEQAFAVNVYDGKWFHPVQAPIAAFLSTMNVHVTGEATLWLRQGTVTVQGRSSPLALFDEKLATYNDGDAFHHQAATGFIELWSLPQKLAAQVRKTVQVAP